MNAGSASGRTNVGISHAPVASICARPWGTNDQSSAHASAMSAMSTEGSYARRRRVSPPQAARTTTGFDSADGGRVPYVLVAVTQHRYVLADRLLTVIGDPDP